MQVALEIVETAEQEGISFVVVSFGFVCLFLTELPLVSNSHTSSAASGFTLQDKDGWLP